MANETRINYSIANQNPAQGAGAAGQLPYVYNSSRQFTCNQTNPGGVGDKLSVPTTAGGTVLPVVGMTALGLIELTNLDPTNYVQWGPTVTGAMVVCGKIKAGESQIFRLDPSVVFRLLANTSAVLVQYKVLED